MSLTGRNPAAIKALAAQTQRHKKSAEESARATEEARRLREQLQRGGRS